MPLRMDAREELTRYVGQRRKVDLGGVANNPNRFRRATRQFRAPQSRAVYGAWKDGDATQASPQAFDDREQKLLTALTSVVSRVGIEPTTRRLRVCCSAN